MARTASRMKNITASTETTITNIAERKEKDKLLLDNMSHGVWDGNNGNL